MEEISIYEMKAEHEAVMREVRALRERGRGVYRNFVGDIFYDEFGEIMGTTIMGVPRTPYVDYLLGLK